VSVAEVVSQANDTVRNSNFRTSLMRNLAGYAESRRSYVCNPQDTPLGWVSLGLPISNPPLFS
jgi:hypothetical protein